MTFESEGLLIVAIYIWLPLASYVVFSDNSGYARALIESRSIEYQMILVILHYSAMITFFYYSII